MLALSDGGSSDSGSFDTDGVNEIGDFVLSARIARYRIAAATRIPEGHVFRPNVYETLPLTGPDGV